MTKPSIFDAVVYREMRDRVARLQPGAIRRWGSMDIAQMLAHANIPLEVGLGRLRLRPEGNFLTRPLLKRIVLRKSSLKPNLPTARQFVIDGERDFEREKQRLLDNLDEAHRRGPGGPWHPHHWFGTLTPQEWGTLNWLHLDHHLKQFSG